MADFDNFDGHDLAGLFIGATLPAGKFSFQIDDVRATTYACIFREGNGGTEMEGA